MEVLIALIGSDYYNNYFSIDKSPSLGIVNNTDGMFGTLTGKIYDKNGHLLTGCELYNSSTDFNMNIKNDGSYSTNVYSTNNPIGVMCYKENNITKQYIYITPINVVMEPDSVVFVDIHLLDSIKVGIENVKLNALTLMKISPNPIKNNQLNYEIALPVQSLNCSIQFINLQSQKTAEFKILESQGIITLPSALEDGIYSTTLIVNGKSCCSAKIIIARK